MPPPLTGQLTFKSSVPPDLRSFTREEVKAYFENTYDLDESLFQGIADEAYYTCPDRLRLPLIFYYAHPAVVYVNKLCVAGLCKQRPNPEFEALFETGVDEMSWDDTEHYRMGGDFKWPAIAAAAEYRKQVRALILNLIDTLPLVLPVTMDSPWWTFFLGFEHERIHIETSSVLIRQLPLRLVTQPTGWTLGPLHAPQPVPANAMLPITGGAVTLGKPDAFPSFGWDNEYGRADVVVPDFQVSQFLVTNRDFLAFVVAGGYTDATLWTPEGWQWLSFRAAAHPMFWVCGRNCKNACGSKLASESHCTHASLTADAPFSAASFLYRTIYAVGTMPWDWPVDCNYLEAKAYCQWRHRLDGVVYRLPTEAEYALLRNPVPADQADSVTSEIIYHNENLANINMVYNSSTPVNLYPPAQSGVHDAQGNVWQWAEDHFNGLPGFKTHFLYDDFSSPCFDSRHTVIMGGSFMSTGDEASRFARFAFRRHFFQHCGFRLVTSAHATPVRLTVMPDEELTALAYIPGACCANAVPSTNSQILLESADFLDATLTAEYGAGNTFTERLLPLLHAALPETTALLLLGAGAGRLTFELTPVVASVLAADFCGKVVEAASRMARDGTLTGPGGVVCTLPAAAVPDRARFMQLTWLPQEVGVFDSCVISKFLSRALNPKSWFPRMREVVRPGGTVVVIDAQWTAASLAPQWPTVLVLVSETVVADDDGTPLHVSVWLRALSQ